MKIETHPLDFVVLNIIPNMDLSTKVHSITKAPSGFSVLLLESIVHRFSKAHEVMALRVQWISFINCNILRLCYLTDFPKSIFRRSNYSLEYACPISFLILFGVNKSTNNILFSSFAVLLELEKQSLSFLMASILI